MACSLLENSVKPYGFLFESKRLQMIVVLIPLEQIAFPIRAYIGRNINDLRHIAKQSCDGCIALLP